MGLRATPNFRLIGPTFSALFPEGLGRHLPGFWSRSLIEVPMVTLRLTGAGVAFLRQAPVCMRSGLHPVRWCWSLSHCICVVRGALQRDSIHSASHGTRVSCVALDSGCFGAAPGGVQGKPLLGCGHTALGLWPGACCGAESPNTQLRFSGILWVLHCS